MEERFILQEEDLAKEYCEIGSFVGQVECKNIMAIALIDTANSDFHLAHLCPKHAELGLQLTKEANPGFY